MTTETMTDELPNITAQALDIPDQVKLGLPEGAAHPPRILLLYGSLRPQSFSRKLALEAQRILQRMGAETRVFDPHDLPMLDSVPADHPKVRELRELSLWSEGQVWVSPERHGAVTGVFKNQIDWLPLEDGSVRPTQGRTLAVMQVCGGSQSFNVVNALRLLGRWMRMVTIPNQSSVAKAWTEFDDAGRMKPSPYYDRVVDVMEELFKFILMIRDRSDYLVDRYSERKGAVEARALSLAAGLVRTVQTAEKPIQPMAATIYHNPACGTSRNTLALIRHAGIEPTIVEYLKDPPSRQQLMQLIADAGLTPRSALRVKEKICGDLGLDAADTSDDALLDAMIEHPILINRPFVVTPLGTRLCRPSERIVDILPAFSEPFVKEDGEVVSPRG